MKSSARGLPITLDLEGARIVVLGGDEEAERKVALLLDAGAQILLLAPSLTPRLHEWLAAGALAYEARPLAEADLDGARLVLVTPREPALAAAICATARARGVLCWACDDPASSDLAMPAVARLGATRIAVSTSGQSPALAGRLRAAFESALGPDADGGRFVRFVELLGALRERAQRDEPDPTRRRAMLLAALDGFELELQARYPAWLK